MSRTCLGAFSAAIALSVLSVAGCLKDADEEGATDSDSGPLSALQVEDTETDGEGPVLTLTADLVDRWIAAAEHDAVAPLLGSLSVRATQDAPEAIRAAIEEGIDSEELAEAVREYDFSGPDEWALVTSRIMSGMVEALAQAHLDLARQMGIDEASPEYQKAAKEVEKELAAIHEALGNLSEPEQTVVTDRLGDIMAAMKGDSAPDRQTEATE